MLNLDEWIAFISTHLPEPVERHEEPDDSMTFIGGDPGQVIVRLGPKAIEVLEYAVSWDTPHAPTLAPRRIGVVVWGRARNEATVKAVGALIAAARESRLSKFRNCRVCEASTPPEWMHGAVCHSCAQRHQGVVH